MKRNPVFLRLHLEEAIHLEILGKILAVNPSKRQKEFQWTQGRRSLFMKETLLKIKYHLSHYVSREFYMSIFIVISGNRWISLMLNIDYLKSFLHILSCQCMQLYLNENLCFEEGLMPSRIVVLQLLQALSCLYFSVTFYPEKENETFWGLREHL